MISAKAMIHWLGVVLGAAGGVLTASLFLGGSSPAEIDLRQQLEMFEGASPEFQDRIRRAYTAYLQAVAPDSDDPNVVANAAVRRRNLEEIHSAVTAEPSLRSKLELFNEWWLNVSAADRDILQETIRSGDVQAISMRIIDDQRSSENILVDFSSGPFRFSRQFGGFRGRGSEWGAASWLSPLELTPAQYAIILDRASTEASLTPEQRSELQNLGDSRHRLLYRTLRLLESIRESGGPGAYERVLPVIEALTVSTAEFDSQWAAEFSERVRGARNPRAFFQRIGVLIATVSVLDQAVIDLGRDLRSSFVAGDSELLEAFEKVPDDLRRGLLTMTPEIARERLQKTAVLEHQEMESPERSLYRQLLEYDDSLMAFQRIFSTRPSGPPFGSRGNNPPRP